MTLRGIALASGQAILAIAAIWSAAAARCEPPPRPLSTGWGVDACLSIHVPRTAVGGYVELLDAARVRWLRERDAGRPARQGVRDPVPREARLQDRKSVV